MRTLIIHNPKSGFGSDAIYQFQRSVVRPGDECVFRLLKDDFDPREAVRDATDFDVVVASGGDGTVSGVMHALAGTGVAVCAFPSGTANLFDANLGNTPEPQSLARACRMGQVADLDLGSLSWVDVDGASHERGFALMSGTGYDAQLMQAALPNKALMGEAAYYAAALANPRPDVVGFRITVDGQTYEREGIMCLVANAAMIQGDVQIVPDCRMDDGALDVIVVKVDSVAQLAGPVLFALLDREGNKIGRPHIESFHGADIVVECSKPVPIEVDGDSEPALVTRYEAHALPGVVRVVVDSMSPYGQRAEQASRFGGTDDVAFPK